MHIEGSLTKWNDDRGFGFITPAQGGQEVFVHISEFPKDGIRPSLGEKLIFEIEIDNNGKKRAKKLSCPQRPRGERTTPSRRTSSCVDRKSPFSFGWALSLLILVSLGVYGYEQYSHRIDPLSAIITKPEIQEPLTIYRCDGRTHCSQMTSCDEAIFFLRNCPNVKMDGNNDGVPCEQQWCKGIFKN